MTAHVKTTNDVTVLAVGKVREPDCSTGMRVAF